MEEFEAAVADGAMETGSEAGSNDDPDGFYIDNVPEMDYGHDQVLAADFRVRITLLKHSRNISTIKALTEMIILLEKFSSFCFIW